MKGHRQACGVALSADLLLDRWTLLIVRDLLTGPKRFTELRRLLSPIVPALLTAKLRDLEARRLVERVDLPVAGVRVYRLTAFGEGLRPTLYALLRWSKGLFEGLSFEGLRTEPSWLLLSVPALLTARPERLTTFRFALAVEGTALVFSVRPGAVEGERASAPPTEPTLAGPYAAVLGYFAGELPDPLAAGLTWTGTPDALATLDHLLKLQSA